ncbi:helicase associated domain-containing protein [Pseudarthrobacter oxydans]|uniref:helicase associated domain-containing protein n=1 Tax=Pseudarthrobacter oxydans TaxID=1671 RepID=UPI00352033EB
MLSTLPGWMQDQRSRTDRERWHARLEELRRFRELEGRWPRFRAPVAEEERVLGVWLHLQRQKFGRGSLLAHELQLLDLCAPGWNAWRVKRMTSGSHGDDSE